MSGHIQVETRIRERAHQIWLDEGCPDGRAEQHWELARLAVTQDGPSSTLETLDTVARSKPIEAVSSQAERPPVTHQGEGQSPERTSVAPPEKPRRSRPKRTR